MTQPVKPKSRADKVSLLGYMKLFRRDILSAQPARLYRAWMAEFKTPFFRSYLMNQPELVKTVLKTRADDFPKSDRVGEGLRPLLGESVFLTNGETWKRQRRLIDPAFEGGRLKDTFPAMHAAGLSLLDRLDAGDQEVEEVASYAAADVIFRTLFSIPIENDMAHAVFHEFKRYQRAQPILNIAAFIPLPKWMPRFHKTDTKASAAKIRALITQMTQERAQQLEQGQAPDDLASKIMTAVDPVTGDKFDWEEMVDQVAIFFLAGHETSASALSWSLYLMALFPDWQEKVAQEATVLTESADFSVMGKLKVSKDVFRETLRLYPPVPMMVRSCTQAEHFRDRDIQAGSQVVLSPWHLHRHERLWDNPDGFDPDRWKTENGRQCQRDAYIPFSTGARVCPGAGFAMIEGPLLLSMILKEFRVSFASNARPVPVAHLTVRSENGIHLRLERREGS